MQQHTVYIYIYIYIYIYANCSAYFGWYLHPSSRTHITVSTVSGIIEADTVTCRESDWMGTTSHPVTLTTGCSNGLCWEIVMNIRKFDWLVKQTLATLWKSRGCCVVWVGLCKPEHVTRGVVIKVFLWY